MFNILWLRRCVLIGLLASCTLLAGGKRVEAYTKEHCFGGDLYIDFFSDAGVYQGYIRERNAPACTENQYTG